MQALGLIETRGLLAAVESADAMLKAADVTLIEKTMVGGGLVSIAVTGGVAAVKASVEAGAAAINKMNPALLVSQHVIPRPHDEVNGLIGSRKPVVTVERKDIEEVKPEDEKHSETEDTSSNNAQEVEPILQNTDSQDSKEFELLPNDSITEENVLDHTQIKEELSTEVDFDKINKDYIDHVVQEEGLEKALKLLASMKVTKLRSIAREYVILRIAGRAISKAVRKMLMKEFEDYYRKNKG